MTPKPHRYLIPFAAFLAILPLLARGPSCGHDFDFHLLSWLEAATQYAHGGYPHWAFTPAYGAGEPRFLFYPPLSWTLGALLTLTLPIQYVATAYTFIALTLSGFTAHRLAGRYASPPVALLCATLYLANPYMLFTAYERTAFAELLAAAWLPLLFLAALKPQAVPQTKDGSPIHRSPIAMSGIHKSRVLAIALPIALLWLTNAPAAVMGCYALAVLTLTRLVIHFVCLSRRESAVVASQAKHPPIESNPATPSFRSLTAKGWGIVSGRKRPPSSPWPLALTTLAGTLLGLLLPAFYLLPAAYERRYVQIALATIPGMRPQDHFLFHRMSTQTPDDLFHNAVVRSASIISLLLLAAILISLAFQSRTTPKLGAPGLASETWVPTSLLLIPLTAILAFLLTPPSLFLWNHTPQLTYLQFPWRLNALLAVILLITAAQSLSFCCHSVAKRRNLRLLFASPAIAAALIFPAYTLFHQSCDATDTPTARAALFHSPLGTEPTDEYTPTTADNDDLRHSTPWWFRCLATNPDPNDAASLMPMPGPAPIHIEWDLPCKALVILNRRAYPTWLVTVNGHPLPPGESNRDDGLISFIEPKGHMSLHIRYLRTPDQELGLVLSALAAVLALLLWKLDKSSPARTLTRPTPADRPWI